MSQNEYFIKKKYSIMEDEEIKKSKTDTMDTRVAIEEDQSAFFSIRMA